MQIDQNPASPPRLLSTVRLLTAGAFLSFFIFGFVDNLKGPTLPDLLRDMSLSYAQGGTLLFAAYIGFVAATLLSGPLADRAGNRLVLMLAGLLISVGIIGFWLSVSYPLLILAILVIGLGMGAIEVGGNGLIIEVHIQDRGRYLNLLAMFHGIGSFLVPLYAAGLLSIGVGWRQVFLYSLPLSLFLFLFFLLVPGPDRTSQQSSHNAFDWSTLRAKGFGQGMIWLYLAIFLYVSTELSIGAWLVAYLQQVKGFGLATSSIYLSLFFGGLLLGRLLGSFVVEGIGYVRSILLVLICALICLLGGLFGPASVAFLLPASGLFLSIIFPTITAIVSARHPQNTGTILGILFAAGGLGGAVGPWTVGFISDRAGIGWGFTAPAVFCGLVILVMIVVRRH